MPARPSPRRPFLTVLVGVLALAAVLAGCSGSVSRDDIRSARGRLTGIDVTGAPGNRPQVRIAAPLKVRETATDTLVDGTGAPVVVDQLLVLALTIYDARTGRKAISTYDEGQRAMAVKNTDGTLFPVLSEALVGLREGSRLVMAVAAEDAYGATGAPQYGIEPGDALVLIADVLAVPPTVSSGPVADPPGPLPRSLFRGPRPGKLQVTTLVEGDGPPVRRGSLVTVHSLAQVWGAREPFEDSFAKEPALVPIGTGTVVAAWDEAFVGVRQGSRIRIVAPPRLAFGATGNPPLVPADSTIVYVVDILGVSGGR